MICTPALQLCFLDIDAGGFCTQHLHRNKINRFLVRAGRLSVFVWTGGDVVETLLRPGEHLDVPAWTVHQFRADDPCRCWEAYFPAHADATVQREDILRLSAGMRRAV